MQTAIKLAGFSTLLAAMVPLQAEAGPAITMKFDTSTLRNVAPGNGAVAPESDNWPITWAADNQQYTSFGDGRGFSTFNIKRASLGVARIVGGKNGYSAYDVFKTGAHSGGWGGKSEGILAIGSKLYLFRNGTSSSTSAFKQTELYLSTDFGQTWTYTGLSWRPSEFTTTDAVFSPTFLQFGKAYAGARDTYLYMYFPHKTKSVDSDAWNVQVPGRVSLFRAPVASIANKASYTYFAGLDANRKPIWTAKLNSRKPVFQDAGNGVMRTSVSYNPGLDKYFLITQQKNKKQIRNFHIGIYSADEPWGPWTKVIFDNANDAGPGLNAGEETVFWNFSNKWLSADGRRFVMVYTGPGEDEWGTIEGDFIVGAN